MTEHETKICTKCKVEQPLANFCKDQTRKDGLHLWCRDCRSARSKSYYRENVDKIAEHINAYRNLNRDKVRACNNAYYEKRRDELRIKHREYNRRHSEELKEKNRAMRKVTKGYWRSWNRHHIDKARGTHTQKDVLELYENQNGKCYWCGKAVGEKYHADHVVPISKGGRNDKSNLVISCVTCNLRKFNKMPEDWMREVNYLRA